MTKLYTVARSDGEDREYNLTTADAAHRILTHDGAEYEFSQRLDGEGFDLWSRQQIAGISWRKTGWFSLETDADAAEADILARVVADSGRGNWRGLIAEDQEAYRASLLNTRLELDSDDDADFIAGIDAELGEIERHQSENV